MGTLILLRATCTILYAETTRSLQRQHIAALHPFFLSPTHFLRHITQYRCVVGGVAATAFMLRDSSVSSDILQVYAPSTTYESFVGALVVCVYNGRHIHDISTPPLPARFCDSRDVSGQTMFHMQNGRTVVVYRGGLVSPCSPIARAPCSALMCFFTQHSFACAYPRLTLQRRSILCDMRLESMDSMERAALDRLAAAGFSFAVSPTAWPEFRSTDAQIRFIALVGGTCAPIKADTSATRDHLSISSTPLISTLLSYGRRVFHRSARWLRGGYSHPSNAPMGVTGMIWCSIGGCFPPPYSLCSTRPPLRAAGGRHPCTVTPRRGCIPWVSVVPSLFDATYNSEYRCTKHYMYAAITRLYQCHSQVHRRTIVRRW